MLDDGEALRRERLRLCLRHQLVPTFVRAVECLVASLAKVIDLRGCLRIGGEGCGARDVPQSREGLLIAALLLRNRQIRYCQWIDRLQVIWIRLDCFTESLLRGGVVLL